jgi:hypothetical protein
MFRETISVRSLRLDLAIGQPWQHNRKRYRIGNELEFWQFQCLIRTPAPAAATSESFGGVPSVSGPARRRGRVTVETRRRLSHVSCGHLRLDRWFRPGGIKMSRLARIMV